MATTQTEADFEQMSWHDCHIWRLEFQVGEPDEDDWTDDLVIGLDFITQWLCGADRTCSFMIAPASLVFHGVTDLRIAIEWGRSGFQTAIHHVAIDRISRELIHDQKVFLDRPYYQWKIKLNWPKDGEISFGAVGYSQTLLAEPVISTKQHLSLKERSRRTSR
jgi:hypothetical protein